MVWHAKGEGNTVLLFWVSHRYVIIQLPTFLTPRYRFHTSRTLVRTQTALRWHQQGPACMRYDERARATNRHEDRYESHHCDVR